ncbi:nuclear transport factor 2 family protein [Flavisphingomonas formosensis]|uniref:nuclear transport factor 2 family protein n=1 Tax=Flavisphingomonas formosensis TaxID=861534 RepID=UPI0012FA4F11|nr:nuclear transport factor 2 family protein [Sphingomonas formosensis]
MPNLIEEMFAWWNEAMRTPELLTAENFARFYTADGRLIVNGNLRATGPAALASHYAAIAARCEEVAMVLPVEEGFATADRAFVHCRTHVVAEGKQAAEEAMAYAVVEDGRIALLRVVSLSV